MPASKLFEPITLGDITLQHRVVLAPLTRFRNTAWTHAPVQPRAAVYYAQRASEPGTLLISEATIIAARASGYIESPGIHTPEQIASWKQTTDAVHARGSFIYNQLFSLGRVAEHDVITKEGFEVTGASDIPIKDKAGPPPRPLTVDEIHEYSQLYATAASNAVYKAGFDGVEIHCCNGYLINEFLEDVSNNRTDEYGGSVENKARFLLETIDAVTKAIGQKKTSLRLSPWTTWQDSRSPNASVIETYSYVVEQLQERFPDLSYLHIIEPRANAPGESREAGTSESNDFIRKIWAPKRLLSAGGHTPASALRDSETSDEVFVFGRLFISNPDLPYRIRNGLSAEKGSRDTYFTTDDTGYADYPFSPEFIAERGPFEL